MSNATATLTTAQLSEAETEILRTYIRENAKNPETNFWTVFLWSDSPKAEALRKHYIAKARDSKAVKTETKVHKAEPKVQKAQKKAETRTPIQVSIAELPDYDRVLAWATKNLSMTSKKKFNSGLFTRKNRPAYVVKFLNAYAQADRRNKNSLWAHIKGS